MHTLVFLTPLLLAITQVVAGPKSAISIATCVASCGPCENSLGTVEPSEVTAISYIFAGGKLKKQTAEDFKCLYDMPNKEATYALHFGHAVTSPDDLQILEALSGTQHIGSNKATSCEVTLDISCSSLNPLEPSPKREYIRGDKKRT